MLLPTLMKSSTSTFGVMTPDLAVTIPTESMLVTSSYVNVPPTLTLPEKVPVVPSIFPLKVVAVNIPASPN